MKKIILRRFLYEALMVVAIAVVLAAGSYLLRPEVLPLVAPSPPAPSDSIDIDLFKVIDFEQARRMYEANEALFADARPLIAYEVGHIEGAIHLDPYAFDQWADTLMAGTAPDQVIVTYCDGPQCTLSRDLAEKLTWLGFERVYYLVDGWGLWQAHGLPVSRLTPAS
jgi:rhodanese-related sulfurtransferase